MSLRVGAEDAGQRLDALLARRGLAASRAAAARLIEQGLVSVDARVRPKSHQVAEGELIALASVEDAPQEEGSGQVPFTIAYEDEHLLVIDKPAGVVVHPGAGRETATLAGALVGRVAGGPDPGRAGIVHRLDRETSGLLVVARSEPAHAALQAMLRERRIQRRYVALVAGAPDAARGTIDAPLGRDRDRRTVISTRTDRPRNAVTHFAVRERLARTSLLDVRLETGRTHQIRAHLDAIGHPVVGDQRYGGRADGRRLGLSRQFLHSCALMFDHPITGGSVSCESKQPAELRRALDAARWEQAPGGPDGS